MLPKYNLNRNIIFLISILLLSMIMLVHTEASSKSNPTRAKITQKQVNSEKHHKNTNKANRKKSDSEDVPVMRINNNMQVRGNITGTRIETKNINITGQAIIAKSSSAQEVEALKIGVQQMHLTEIKSPNGVITISGNLVINNNIGSDSSISAKSFIVQGVKQWSLRHHDDFDSNNSLIGWNRNQTSNCSGINNFLGGPCHLSYDEATKLYEKLPTHSQIRINARLHMFDDWNGEKAYMKVDDKVVWTKTGKNSRLSGTNICGSNSNDPAFAVPIDIVIPHNDSTINISFGSTLKRNPCDASFGVDDVMIYVK